MAGVAPPVRAAAGCRGCDDRRRRDARDAHSSAIAHPQAVAPVSTLNATHDPALRSWVDSANAPAADFPLQNLPFAVFRRARSGESFRGAVAIGDAVLDLGALQALGVFAGSAAEALALAARPALNAFMAAGQEAGSALRAALSAALRSGAPLESALRPLLVPQ